MPDSSFRLIRSRFVPRLDVVETKKAPVDAGAFSINRRGVITG
jgi:hypothetical protein